MNPIRFTKMHGIGNDYVFVNCFEQKIDEPAELSRRIADRHRGVGGDGLILIMPPEESVDAHVRMRMFNVDGSESEMCGNGIRCVCKYAHDHGLASANPMRVQTGAGVLTLDYQLDRDGLVEQVTVDMGAPILELAAIPVDQSQLAWTAEPFHGVEIGDATLSCVFVSMGNPHAILFRDENPEMMLEPLEELDVSYWGEKIERHPAFPNRVNVHFAAAQSRTEVTMRTWERGSGITEACGTGASAVCAAFVLASRTEREILVHLPGGDLSLRWDEESDHVFMTGQAREVFSGDWTG